MRSLQRSSNRTVFLIRGNFHFRSLSVALSASDSDSIEALPPPLRALRSKPLVPRAGHNHGKKRAVVLLPVVGRGHDLSLLYTLRATNLSKHAGEVCFPGGFCEEQDLGEPAGQGEREGAREGAALWRTGVREVWEELGVPAFYFTPVAFLPPVPSGRNSNTIVQGIVAHYTGPLPIQSVLTLNPREVDTAFTLSLQLLRASQTFEQVQGFNLPRYQGVGIPHPVWGLTAHLTQSFLKLLQEIESSVKPLSIK